MFPCYYFGSGGAKAEGGFSCSDSAKGEGVLGPGPPVSGQAHTRPQMLGPLSAAVAAPRAGWRGAQR